MDQAIKSNPPSRTPDDRKAVARRADVRSDRTVLLRLSRLRRRSGPAAAKTTASAARTIACCISSTAIPASRSPSCSTSLSITKQSLNRVLKELLERAMSKRAPAIDDRRQRLLYPTREGRRLAMELAAIAEPALRARARRIARGRACASGRLPVRNDRAGRADTVERARLDQTPARLDERRAMSQAARPHATLRWPTTRRMCWSSTTTGASRDLLSRYLGGAGLSRDHGGRRRGSAGPSCAHASSTSSSST